MKKVSARFCCVPLGSETRKYQFPSGKLRSAQLVTRNYDWESGNLKSTPSFRLRTKLYKLYMVMGHAVTRKLVKSYFPLPNYEFPSPMERSICAAHVM